MRRWGGSLMKWSKENETRGTNVLMTVSKCFILSTAQHLWLYMSNFIIFHSFPIYSIYIGVIVSIIICEKYISKWLLRLGENWRFKPGFYLVDLSGTSLARFVLTALRWHMIRLCTLITHFLFHHDLDISQFMNRYSCLDGFLNNAFMLFVPNVLNWRRKQTGKQSVIPATRIKRPTPMMYS